MRQIAPVPMLLAVTLGVAAAFRAAAADEVRVLAIGDIHGAYEELVELLARTGLIDEDLRWSGGTTTVVQTGDFLDRGAGARAAMDLLMRLQQEAAAAGGRLEVLLGNHEALNLIGDLRDVTPEIFASFAGEDPDGELDAAYRAYERTVLRGDRAYSRLSVSRRRQVRARWMSARPAGFVEYQRAIGLEGEYGPWLRSLPVATRVDGVLFMHAGIGPGVAAMGVDAIVDRVAAEIEAFDEFRHYLRERGQITDIADIAELIAGAARETAGLEWLPDFAPDLLAPPPLPPPGSAESASARDFLLPLLRLEDWYLLAPQGPLWFRGWAQWDETRIDAVIDPVLAQLGVRAMVSGHTPQSGGIRSRFAGRVFLIDSGMLRSVYGGRAGALEISASGAVAVYADGSRIPLDAAALLEPQTSDR